MAATLDLEPLVRQLQKRLPGVTDDDAVDVLMGTDYDLDRAFTELAQKFAPPP